MFDERATPRKRQCVMKMTSRGFPREKKGFPNRGVKRAGSFNVGRPWIFTHLRMGNLRMQFKNAESVPEFKRQN